MKKSNYTILLVDDDDDFRFAVSKIVKGAGYKFLEASNLLEAAHLCSENPPHLILLDLNLEQEKGGEFLSLRQSNNYLKRIPVIIFSQQNDKDVVVSCLKLGVDDYLLKPLNAKKLLFRIASFFKDRKRVEYNFPLDQRPIVDVIHQGEFLNINEVGGKIRSQVKITNHKKIIIEGDIVSEVFEKGVSVNAYPVKTSVSPGIYDNEFSFFGVNLKSLRKIRQLTSSWRVK